MTLFRNCVKVKTMWVTQRGYVLLWEEWHSDTKYSTSSMASPMTNKVYGHQSSNLETNRATKFRSPDDPVGIGPSGKGKERQNMAANASLV